jgi:hypothetical protein
MVGSSKFSTPHSKPSSTPATKSELGSGIATPVSASSSFSTPSSTKPSSTAATTKNEPVKIDPMTVVTPTSPSIPSSDIVNPNSTLSSSRFSPTILSASIAASELPSTDQTPPISNVNTSPLKSRGQGSPTRRPSTVSPAFLNALDKNIGDGPSITKGSMVKPSGDVPIESNEQKDTPMHHVSNDVIFIKLILYFEFLYFMI